MLPLATGCCRTVVGFRAPTSHEMGCRERKAQTKNKVIAEANSPRY